MAKKYKSLNKKNAKTLLDASVDYRRKALKDILEPGRISYMIDKYPWLRDDHTLVIILKMK